jgi:hypothetical protein
LRGINVQGITASFPSKKTLNHRAGF